MDITRFEGNKILYKKVLENIQYDSKQNIIICGLVPSLEYIGLVKLAIILFQSNIPNAIDQSFNFNQYSEKDAIKFYEIIDIVQSEVLEKSSSLVLTFPCKSSFKQLIKSIIYEMREFFLQHISKYINNSSFGVSSAKEIILASYTNICWTQDGKINLFKTMVNIIEYSTLGTIDKYILACNNCLEDNILNILKIVPESLIIDLNIKARNKYPLVSFWTYHFKGEIEKFSELINGEEIYEYLLNWTINNHLKLAWHYFWENFADDAMKNRHLSLVESNEYISLPYLLIQMGFDKIEDFFCIELVGICFANTLNHISKSCKIVLVPQYLLDYIKTYEVCTSYEVINHSWTENHITTNEYFKIWEEFTLHNNNGKILILDASYDYYYYLRNSIFIDDGFQTLKFLLKLITYQKIKDFLYDHWFEICYYLICQSTDRFNKIIKLFLISEEEIFKFKNTIFSDCRFDDIYFKLIISDKFEIIEDILFVFCSKEGINRYKNDLPFKNNASIILKICKGFKHLNRLSLLNKFINWCYNGNEEEVTGCKAIIFDLETHMYVEQKVEFFNNFNDLIKTKKWDVVDKFFEWIFFATKNTIDTTESKCERFKFIFNHTNVIDCSLLWRFISSHFEHCEYDILRIFLTNKIILIAVQNLLNLDNHQEADNLLEWRFSSNKNKIDKFKDLFMRVMGRKFLLKVIKYRSYIVKAESLFKWYKPSIASANIFKESFENFFKNKRKLQLSFLGRSKKLTIRSFRVWDRLNIRMDKSLALLSNHVEEKI